MAQGTLHATQNNFRTFEALIAAKYGKSEVKVDYADPHTGVQCPLGRLPCLQTKSGEKLAGSHAVAKFLAKEALSASSTDQTVAAQLLHWFELVDNQLVPNALAWLLPSVSAVQQDQKQTDDAKTETLRMLKALNEYLLPKTFLVGERLSLADVAVSCAVLPLFQNVLDAATRKQYVNLTRWFETCIHQPEFKAVLGEVHLCDKASHFDAQKFKTFQESSSSKPAKAAKEDKSGKKDKEKKESAKPKEKSAKAEDEEPDASEEALAQEPKQNDPFAAMPKSNFNLEEFKRVYSNEDTVTKALPYFWQHLDAENYSIWHCEYKYPSELTLCFMSCNLISGMYQRLDKLRKNAFASMILFGSDNNSTISGIWVWKGHDLAFTLSDDWKVDYESYEWKKLDAKAPATKTMINEYFAWEGKFDGKKFNQGKIFK